METLRTETSQKSLIKTFCYNNKITNKVTKRLPKLSKKEIYFTLLISNSTKYSLSSSFHGQTSLRNTIFSVLISGVKLLLIHNWFKKCWWIASYVFSILYNLIHFSLPFRPCNLLFQKKSKQGGRGKGFPGQFLWNIQGYQRKSMWNFQGLIKNKMEFSKGDQEKMWKFHGSV